MNHLLNKKVLVFCTNYFYYGELIRVGTDLLILKNCYQVFETGKYDGGKFKDAQFLSAQWGIKLSSIESIGLSPKSV